MLNYSFLEYVFRATRLKLSNIVTILQGINVISIKKKINEEKTRHNKAASFWQSDRTPWILFGAGSVWLRAGTDLIQLEERIKCATETCYLLAVLK